MNEAIGLIETKGLVAQIEAADAMGPAAAPLADIALETAVPPEPEALQHLLRAEAAFTDVQVAFQQQGGGGGGGGGWVILCQHDADGAAGVNGPMNRWYGGMVHELGHALGWVHSGDDGTAEVSGRYRCATDVMSDSAAPRSVDATRRDGPDTLAIDRYLVGWIPRTEVAVVGGSRGSVALAPSTGGVVEGAHRLAVVPLDDGRFATVEVLDAARSEERRVGKECRSRWSPYH